MPFENSDYRLQLTPIVNFDVSNGASFIASNNSSSQNKVDLINLMATIIQNPYTTSRISSEAKILTTVPTYITHCADIHKEKHCIMHMYLQGWIH
jgi:hypothetical protein